MRSAVFADRLNDFAVTLEADCKRRVAPSLKRLATKLHDCGGTSVRKLLEGVTISDDSGPERCQDENLMATRVIEKFKEFLTEGDRRSAGRDFTALRGLVAQQPGISIARFVELVLASLASNETPGKPEPLAMDQQQIEQFVSDLEASYKEPEAFSKVFEKLKAASVRREEAVEIASRFMGKMAKSATKQAALKRIWARHESLMDNRAKRRAFGGRTAA